MITLVDGTVIEVGVEAFDAPRCFAKREDIKYVDIPEGVKTIRKESFIGCVNLECVSIPFGVTTIEPSAFEGCAKLQGIAFPESLKALGEHAFCGTGLVCVELPSRLKTMGKLVFDKCPNLQKIVVPEGYKAQSIGVYADRVGEVVIPEGMDLALENAPRSDWYYRLNCKDMALFEKALRSDVKYKEPVCFYSCFMQRIYGPFFTPAEAYDGIREDIAEFARSIEPGDSDLLAATLALRFLSAEAPESYDVRCDDMRSGKIECHPVPGYAPGDPLYIVEVEMRHDSSFHPWTELQAVFTAEHDATLLADAIWPRYDYPISSGCATVRSVIPSGGIIELCDGEYLDGYSDDDAESRLEEEE